MRDYCVIKSMFDLWYKLYKERWYSFLKCVYDLIKKINGNNLNNVGISVHIILELSSHFTIFIMLKVQSSVEN